MQAQRSFLDDGQGMLYIVPTPIGNLDDMTFRAVQTLKDVQIILAEDTRHTQKLLHHFTINTRLLSYHEHNKKERTNQIIQKLQAGENMALVSDAGMPAISDPGHDLVKEVIAANLRLTVLPGANAALSALVGSGLNTEEFLFTGFLPRKKQAKEDVLHRLDRSEMTFILYESPFRVKDTVQMIVEQLSPRKLVIAREITKLYEEFIRGEAKDVLNWLHENPIKGECCIVVEGTTDEEESKTSLWWTSMSIVEHVNYYEAQENIPHKLALKEVAKDRNMSRRDVYSELHVKPKK